MKKNYNYHILWLACLFEALFGQQLFGQEHITPRDGVISPQNWQVMTFGDHPMDLHTGTVGVKIPVYTYEDRDFNLPITLNYSANGFKPHQQADVVGYSWYMTAGGVITREMRGMYDEEKKNNPYSSYQGYWYYHQLSSTEGQIRETKRQGQWDADWLWNKIGSAYYEMEPDLFHFNFMGYSGSFQLGPNGTFVVYNTSCPSGEIKIKEFGYGNYLTEDFRISILTGDGYEYIFGGNEENIDYADYIESEDRDASRSYNRVGHKANAVAWHLVKVIAPNRREINFTYGIRRNIISNYQPRYWREFMENTFPDTPWGTEETFSNATLLKSIEIDDWKAEFDYEKRDENSHEIVKNNGLLGIVYSSDLLRTITIAKNTDGTKETLKTCRLTHSGQRKKFLTQVELSGEGSYRMAYYGDLDDLPPIDTYAVDHWGYWNNKATHLTFIPIKDWNWPNPPEFNKSNPDILFSDARDPNIEKTKQGMLTDITFPTGGRSHFEYEGNDYSWAMKHRPSGMGYINDYALTLCMETGKAGGLRIKSVTGYDRDNSVISTKRYQYSYDDTGELPDDRTGILLRYPRYRIAVPYSYISKDEYIGIRYILKSDWNLFTRDKGVVEYMTVFEIFGDKSRTEYEFSTQLYKIDLVEYDTFPEYSPWTELKITDQWRNGVYNLLKRPNSAHNERGRLISKFTWDHTYGQKWYYSNSYDKYIETPMYTGLGGCFRHKEYLTTNRLDSVVYKRTNGYISGAIAYKYNKYNQLSKEIKYGSIGSPHRNAECTYYTYVQEKPDRSAVDMRMIEKNIISNPMTIRKTYRDENSERLTGYQETEYDVFSGRTEELLLPARIKSASIPQSTPAGDFADLTMTEDMNYDLYDPFGNVQQQTDKARNQTNFIWSKDGLRLLAVVRNASKLQVRNIISGIASDSMKMSLSPEQETKLRSLRNTLVTTYKYLPYIGITEVRDPANRKRTFTYNASGKLEAEFDSEENIVREYNYFTDKK